MVVESAASNGVTGIIGERGTLLDSSHYLLHCHDRVNRRDGDLYADSRGSA